LWIISVTVITASFFIFDGKEYLTFFASLIGVTSLIFCAKGNPFGQVLMIVFGTIYGFISYGFKYYGEMITYMCMTVPMAVISLVSWLRNPFKGKHSEVTVNRIGKREIAFMLVMSAVASVIFWFILDTFGTSNLLPSTASVTTSFIAAYLTFRRSPFFDFAYALNDVVLIVLWILACAEDITYASVVACFVAFIANDMYGFFHWRSMQRAQQRKDFFGE
jgi:nicotinamide mononucleotide transporter PnuC